MPGCPPTTAHVPSPAATTAAAATMTSVFLCIRYPGPQFTMLFPALQSLAWQRWLGSAQANEAVDLLRLAALYRFPLARTDLGGTRSSAGSFLVATSENALGAGSDCPTAELPGDYGD